MKPIAEIKFKPWSCDFILELINPTLEPQIIETEIKSLLHNYENSFSRFIKNTEVGKLNAGEKILPSSLFESVLKEAKSLTEIIGDDYFNPHVNLSSQGYDVSIEKITDNQIVTQKKFKPLSFPSGLNQTENHLQLKAGGYIDFGSFLKGRLSAEIADKYKSVCDGLVVNFGGDLTVRGQDQNTDYFEIGIYNPVTHQDHPIKLTNQSLCTSGIYKRTWEQNKQTVHHITDPLTNQNSHSEFISISFWGSSGSVCDALATAAFNAEPVIWEQWILKYPNTYYLAIYKSGEIITSSNLSE